jgi:hypothetical protein
LIPSMSSTEDWGSSEVPPPTVPSSTHGIVRVMSRSGEEVWDVGEGILTKTKEMKNG